MRKAVIGAPKRGTNSESATTEMHSRYLGYRPRAIARGRRRRSNSGPATVATHTRVGGHEVRSPGMLPPVPFPIPARVQRVIEPPFFYGKGHVLERRLTGIH